MSNSPRTNYRSSKIWLILFGSCLLSYCVLWAGGIASHWFLGGVRADKTWLASLFLFLAGTIVFMTARSKGEVLMFAGFAVFGFGAEVVGVHFGFPFGSYQYTDILGPKLMGVPVVMAYAWVTVISYVREILIPFNLPRWIEVIAAAFCVTAIDLIIDPLAVNQLGYWHWDQPGNYYNIPATNFAGWFLTGFIAFSLFHKKTKRDGWRLHLGMSIVLFFTLLALIYKMYSITLIGFVLCLPYLFQIYSLYKENKRSKIKN